MTGREDLLGELRTALVKGGTAALTQAITGLGGIGKTQTAVEYAYRHQDYYGVVGWVNAAEVATLPSQLAQMPAADLLQVCVTSDLDWQDSLGVLRDYSLIEVGRGPEDPHPNPLPEGEGTHSSREAPVSAGGGGIHSQPAIPTGKGGEGTPYQPAGPSLPLGEGRGEGLLSVHRLVQAVTRARLDADATRTWAEAAVRVLNAAYPGIASDYRNWPDCERLLAPACGISGTACSSPTASPTTPTTSHSYLCPTRLSSPPCN